MQVRSSTAIDGLHPSYAVGWVKPTRTVYPPEAETIQET